jgi:hypothetical protein
MEITLAIIGTAGRADDFKKLSKNSFSAMLLVSEELIKQLSNSNYPITHLISGGAAWADFVAIKLYLNKIVKNLRLYIPCQFKDGTFIDEKEKLREGLSDVNKFSTDQTLNYYHQNFQRKTGINSLSDMQIAKHKGAEFIPCKGGFYGRNAMVAKSDILLAMTFGEPDQPGNFVKDGGTADTVRRYLSRVNKEGFFNKSFHYNLTDGKIYDGVDALPATKKVSAK